MKYNSAVMESVEFQLFKYQFIRLDEIDMVDTWDYFDNEYPCSIYFICDRPKAKIDKGYIQYDETFCEIKIFIQEQEKIFEEIIRFDHNYPGLESLTIQSSYPHTYFNIVDECGTSLYGGKTNYFLDEVQRSYKKLMFPALRDLHVLYVGKSIDESDPTPALKRIKRHETFLKILHDNTTYFPDQEASLLLCSFKQNNSVKRNSALKLNAAEQELDKIKLSHLIQNPTAFTEMQRISLIEAGIIHLFKPKYNDHYKHNFPSPSHTQYNNLYHSGLEDVYITLDFSELQLSLYTGSCKRDRIFLKKVTFELG